MSLAFSANILPPEERAPFVTHLGQTLWLEFAVETVTSLRHDTAAAARIARTLTDTKSSLPLSGAEQARFCDEDLLRVDEETFEFTKTVMDGPDAPAMLIMPVSFHTLASRKGRRVMADKMGDRLKLGAILELMGVDRGTPLSRLAEVGGIARMLSRGVLVRLAGGRDMTAPVRGYRPHGVTIDARELGATDTDLASGMLAFAEQAKGAAPTLMVFGLPSDDFFAVASVGGITHASVARPA